MNLIRPAALALLVGTIGVSAWPASCPAPAHVPKTGAVASESCVCSKIGIDLLKKGGNAVDAAVGTIFCVGVIGMYHSGIGGGGFMLLRDKQGKYEFIDFRDTAPAAAFEDMYKNDPKQSLFGGLASAVPGELRGTEYAHRKYGVLPWADVVAPAIHVARNGFEVSEDLVRYMDSTSPNNFLVEDPAWAVDFAPTGKRVALGEIMTRKRFADTLEAIAQHGADAFYMGSIANATVQALKRANGTMTLDDLKNYTIAIREPLNITYRGHKLTSTNAPSSGPVALSALNILSGYDDLYTSHATLNLSTHRLDQAMKFAYGQRAHLGDPSFIEGTYGYTQDMISADVGSEIRSKINDDKSYGVEYYDPPGLESLDTPGTSHVVAADKDGMAVSVTTTINTLFGSSLIIPETGVIMNNGMNDFSIPGESNAFGYIPSPANFIRPGKRPLSSISPIIGETPDGRLYFAIGSAGGSRITTATIQNVVHLLDQNMTISDALAQPRLHDQLVPAKITFEYTYDNTTVAYLHELGNNVSWVAPGQSTAQGLRLLHNGTFEAGGEPRQRNSGGFAI